MEVFQQEGSDCVEPELIEEMETKEVCEETGSTAEEDTGTEITVKLTDGDLVENPISINIAQLSPGKLLRVEIGCGSHKIMAMVDSGAGSNYIKQSVVDDWGLDIEGKKSDVFGFGLESIRTIGNAEICLEMCG